MEKKNTHFRFRYNTYYRTKNSLPKPLDSNLDKLVSLIYIDEDDHEVDHYDGEISVSTEWFEKDNDTRDQISIKFNDLQYLAGLESMLKKIGLINSFIINKERKEYGHSFLEDFRKEIHIEIDTDIVVFYQGKKIFLEHTLQICKEGQSIDIANREIEGLLRKLDLSGLNVEHTTKGYLERAKEKV